MTGALSVIVLAAGKGTRMRSERPKVLHPVGGEPMLFRVLDAAADLQPAAIHVVYGHGGEAVLEALDAQGGRWPEVTAVHQADLLGTGDAVARALPSIPDDHRVLVLCGDVPLVRSTALAPLARGETDAVALLTAHLDDPTGYGRILRTREGAVSAIVEERDARPEEARIQEVNTGILAAPAARLRAWVSRLGSDNAQGEYYLTDVVAMAVAEDTLVEGWPAPDVTETLGVNDPRQLAAAERTWQRRVVDGLLEAGLRVLDPERVDVRGTLEHGRDCELAPNVFVSGRVSLGDRVVIGPGVVLRDSAIGDDCVVEAYSVVEGCRIAGGCRIGPFARLRPDTALGAGARVGNFVETKASTLGAGAKVNHLSYVGDAEVGARANIGAGTITCNYDGVRKHRTVIGDDAFVGSDTQLVAPVTVGPGAVIGAGTTLTRDAPEQTLTLSRAPQRSVPGWRRLTADRKAPEHDSSDPSDDGPPT